MSAAQEPLPGQPRQLAQLFSSCWIYSPLDGTAEPGAWALVTTVRPGPGWTRIYGVDQVTGQRVYVSGRPEREVHACTRDEARAAQLALLPVDTSGTTSTPNTRTDGRPA